MYTGILSPEACKHKLNGFITTSHPVLSFIFLWYSRAEACEPLGTKCKCKSHIYHTSQTRNMMWRGCTNERNIQCGSHDCCEVACSHANRIAIAWRQLASSALSAKGRAGGLRRRERGDSFLVLPPWSVITHVSLITFEKYIGMAAPIIIGPHGYQRRLLFISTCLYMILYTGAFYGYGPFHNAGRCRSFFKSMCTWRDIAMPITNNNVAECSIFVNVNYNDFHAFHGGGYW